MESREILWVERISLDIFVWDFSLGSLGERILSENFFGFGESREILKFLCDVSREFYSGNFLWTNFL